MVVGNSHLERVASLFRGYCLARRDWIPSSLSSSTSKINRLSRLARARASVPITLTFLINGNDRQRSRPPSREDASKGSFNDDGVKRRPGNCTEIRGNDSRKIDLSTVSSDCLTSSEERRVFLATNNFPDEAEELVSTCIHSRARSFTDHFEAMH